MNAEELAAFRALLVAAPPGPRAELGVYRGGTLALIADHPGETIGVDTFAGMPEPDERDIRNGWNPYPKGKLSAPMKAAAGVVPKARLLQGRVEDVLPSLSLSGFGFVHVDLDHYGSTLFALEWAWPRMCDGGILCSDDWFADRDWLAAGACHEFAGKIGKEPQTFGRKAWWVRQ